MLTVGRLAQLVRAPRLHRGSRGFESLTAHHVPKINCRQRRWLHSERRGVDVGGPSIWCQTEPLWDFGGIQEQDYRLWSWPFDLQVARVAGQGRNGVLARWVEKCPATSFSRWACSSGRSWPLPWSVTSWSAKRSPRRVP